MRGVTHYFMQNEIKKFGRRLKKSFLFYNKNSFAIFKVAVVAFVPLIILDRLFFIRFNIEMITSALIVDMPIYFGGKHYLLWQFVLIALSAFILGACLFFLYQIALLKTIHSTKNNKKLGVFSTYWMSWGELRSFCYIFIKIFLWYFIFSLLFIIPGFIVIGLFSFSFFVLIFDGKKGSEAMKASKKMVMKNAAVFAGNVLPMLLITAVFYFLIIFSQETLFKVHVSCYLSTGALMGEIVQDLTTVVMSIYPVIFLYLLYQELKNN